MTSSDRRFFLILGVVLWTAGTLLYRSRGTMLFESGAFIYWANFAMTVIAFCAVFIQSATRRKICRGDWPAAALTMAVPGLFGESITMLQFPTILPALRADSAAPYAAFLFGGYGLFLLVVLIAQTPRRSPHKST